MNNVKLARALYRTILRREPSHVETLQIQPDLMMRRYFDVLDRLVTSDEAQAVAAQTLKLFAAPGHFYSPIVDAEDLRRAPPLQSDGDRPAMASVAIDGPRMLEFWQRSRSLLEECPFPTERTAGFRYCFENPAFRYSDAITLYLMLRTHRPRRVIEVGSGYSSACLLDTIERYLPAATSVTFVEPHPELLLSLMTSQDRQRVRLIDKPVQHVDLGVFDQLGENDILFVDSTHVAKTGSDVCHEIFNILPFLNKGTLIHFHDVFYPFEYPDEWVYGEGRSWNEIYLMRAFLMYNDAFEIEFFNNYFGHFFAREIEASRPDFLKDRGASLWLRKHSPALARTDFPLRKHAPVAMEQSW